jgi:penicillin-binding protein 2
LPGRQDDEAPRGLLRRDDTKFAAGRIALFQYLTLAIFLYLLSGFWDLQVVNPELYSERADRNRIKSVPVSAPRGKILDRDGRVIVDNRSTFSLMLSRENLRQEQVAQVLKGLDADPDEVADRLRRFRSRPRYQPVTIKEELTKGELAFIEAHRGDVEYPDMELVPLERRLYPRTAIAAHLIGYTGEVTERELNTAEFAKCSQGEIIGKTGVERQYNDILAGRDGQRQVVVDIHGVERQVIGLKEAVAGRSIRLTIDLDLQVVADLSLEGRKGAVVALDPRNGEVLAMASQPAFDPSLFVGGMRRADWQAITENPDTPMLNRAIQAQLSPGSTFKPIMAMAGLESGKIDTSETFYCPGGATFYGRFFGCHLKGGHGTVNLHKAIEQSCDVYFYNLGNRLGIDKIAEYAEMFGFGKRTGIDLPNEAQGLVPSTRWKIRTNRERWYAGETISVAIGQGQLTVTPLQLAYAIGGLAMGGEFHTPHVMSDFTPQIPPRRIDIKPENVAAVLDGMLAVVNEGTGKNAQVAGIEVCGKTGTAQLASNNVLRETKLGQTLKDNAWFVGFAPRHNPEIVVVALVEGGLHGSTAAAPIARDLIRTYFNKKSKASPPAGLLAQTGGPRTRTPEGQ